MIEVIAAPKFPRSPRKEIFKVLFEDDRTKIEAIVSPTGSSSPEDGSWYNQEWDEYVYVVSGSANLLFKEGNRSKKMIKGESIYIHAHVEHRVTNMNHRTEWLAYFIKK